MITCTTDDDDDNEESLQQFTSETDSWINCILSSLSWTQSSLFKAEDLIRCPVNEGHFISAKSSKDHTKLCALVSKGYSKEELNSDQSSKFFYEKAPLVFSLDLDESTLLGLLANTGGAVPSELPATMNQSMISLTADQRLSIYDYCIKMAREARHATQFVDEDLMLIESSNAQSCDKPQSKLEELAKQRDLKRRRQSYRGKNTHTSKKSHTEVMRDMLCNQMEILASIWADEAKCKEERDKSVDKERETIPRSPGSTIEDDTEVEINQNRCRRDKKSSYESSHRADSKSERSRSRKDDVSYARHDGRSRDKNDVERRRYRSRSRDRERRNRAEEEKYKRAEINYIRDSCRTSSRKVRVVSDIKEDPERTVRRVVIKHEPSDD